MWAKTAATQIAALKRVASSTPKQTINAGLACVGTSAGAGANQVIEVSAGTYTETIGPGIPSGTLGVRPLPSGQKMETQ